jgi:hypothetical protein
VLALRSRLAGLRSSLILRAYDEFRLRTVARGGL